MKNILDVNDLRKTILRMAFKGSTVHIACSLSIVEILAVIYRSHLNYDVKKIDDHPMLDKINTKDEWVDLMQVVLDMGDEIKTVNASVMKQFLQQAIQSINIP